MPRVDTFAEIADERRGMADLAAGLTAGQLATPSLCSAWTVHDVLAHLVVPLEVGLPRFLLAMLVSRGNFDRANVRLTRELAARPAPELAEVLRSKADSRFTPPGSGPEAPLTDLVVHGLDVRRPLGLPREIPAERLRTALAFAVASPVGGAATKGALGGLRFEAEDLDWSSGSGPVVRGPADELLLAVTGRTTALDSLGGDGLPTLRSRLAP